MPKIRGIKPDFWTDEDIVELTIPARLLFIGLWTYACDNGHLQDKPKQLKMRIFPGDDVSAADLLRELERSGRIMRVGGWIIVPNFTRHQKPDKRYFQTCDKDGCERPPADSQPGTRGGHDESTTSPRGAHTVGSMGPHVDGDGDGDGELMVKEEQAVTATPKAEPTPRKRGATSKRQLPDDFAPNDTNRRIAAERGLDLRAVFEQFADHHRAKGSTMKDWHLAFNTWLRNERPRRPEQAAPESNAAAWLRLANDSAQAEGTVLPFQLGGGS